MHTGYSNLPRPQPQPTDRMGCALPPVPPTAGLRRHTHSMQRTAHSVHLQRTTYNYNVQLQRTTYSVQRTITTYNIEHTTHKVQATDGRSAPTDPPAHAHVDTAIRRSGIGLRIRRCCAVWHAWAPGRSISHHLSLATPARIAQLADVHSASADWRTHLLQSRC